MRKLLEKLYRALPVLTTVIGLAMCAVGVGMVYWPAGLIFTGLMVAAGGFICAVGLPEEEEEVEE